MRMSAAQKAAWSARNKARSEGAAEIVVSKLTFSTVFNKHFVKKINDAELNVTWFGDNPRGDDNDGTNVAASYAQHGELKDEAPMIWMEHTGENVLYQHVPTWNDRSKKG